MYPQPDLVEVNSKAMSDLGQAACVPDSRVFVGGTVPFHSF